MKRLSSLVLILLLVGVMVALVSDLRDATPGFKDATREIGGAIVSGALVAYLVVWFEQRREDQRVEREEHRDDEAARRAWVREIDVRLISVSRTELPSRRDIWLEGIEEETTTRDFVPGDGISSTPTRSFASVCLETRSLLEFLR